MASALLCAALLLLIPGTLSQDKPEPKTIQISLVVENSIDNLPPLTFNTRLVYRGILIGAMKRLMASNANFRFTYTEDPNYGPYLESVNGLSGSDKDHTYWELLVEAPNDTTIRPNVGIGCYIPSENEKIILRFTKW